MKLTHKIALAGLVLFLVAGIAASQGRRRFGRQAQEDVEAEGNPFSGADGEFRLGRVKYKTFGGAGSHGLIQPWWAIDYPFAEEHFFAALRRITNISVADAEDHLELTDPQIFQHPFLFLQQPGQGNWRPTDEDAANLREYLLRGGFLLIDDLHGEYDWQRLQAALYKVMPDRQIVEIPEDDPLMHIFYDLQQGTPIPGVRHLRRGPGGQIVARMQGPSSWRGIYNDDHHLMVAINFNIDMGDAWEHADDPIYPVPMTAMAYRLGTNYVIYAMTH
jgi:hypothetical protein